MGLIKKLTLILVITFGLSLSFHLLVKKGLNLYLFHYVTKFDELLMKKGEQHDIVILGSSVAHRGINPRVIDSVCSVNSYNAGVDGASVFEFYHLFKSYLKNNPAPKCALLNLDVFSFRLEGRTFFFPLYVDYTDNPEVTSMISERGYSTPVYKSMPFVLLSDLDDNAKGTFLKGFMGKNDLPQGDFQYKGYVSNSEQTLMGDTIMRYPKREFNKSSLIYMDKITALCKQKNIKLVLNCAPIFKQASVKNYQDKNQSTIDYIVGFAKKNKLTLLRGDSLNSITNNPNYFANHGHLNKPGAVAYSKLLGRQLNQIMLLHLPNRVAPNTEHMAAVEVDAN